VDPQLPQRALRRLIGLLEETAGGCLVGSVVDLFPHSLTRPTVALRHHRIAGLLGLDLDVDAVTQLLNRGDLVPSRVTEVDGETTYFVDPPSHRFDIDREVDLIEEVARMHGFDQIPQTHPTGTLRAVPRQPEGPDMLGIRRALAGQGMSETVHFSFIDPDWLVRLGLTEEHPWIAKAVVVDNPLSEVGGVLRPTLLPSLLKTVRSNLVVGARDIRLFETRTVFLARDEGVGSVLNEAGGRPLDKSPVIETRVASGVLSGRRYPRSWSTPTDDPVDIYDAIGCVEAVGRAIGWRGFSIKAGKIPAFIDPKEGAVLMRGAQVAGWIGRVSASVLQAFELDVAVYAFELDIDAVTPKKTTTTQFESFSRFPSSERDLAVVVSKSVSAGALVACASKAAHKGLKDAFRGVSVFDVYEGDGIDQGQCSIGLRFQFRAPDRTLKDEVVDAVMSRVESALANQLQATIRQ